MAYRIIKDTIYSNIIIDGVADDKEVFKTLKEAKKELYSYLQSEIDKYETTQIRILSLSKRDLL